MSLGVLVVSTRAHDQGKPAEVEYEIEEEYDTGAGSFDAEAFAMSFSSIFKRPTLD